MDAQEFSKYGHVFRPGPFRQKQAFWLNGGVLHWRKGDEKGHVALSEISEIAVRPGSRGSICRLTETGGRIHDICERHWFGWEIGERRRIGMSELRSATFASLVSALRWRLKKDRG